MPVSALVITLSNAPEDRQAALTWLAEDGRFTLGSAKLDQLPVVLETAGLKDGARVIREELPEVRGVEFVYVVSVDFSDLEASPNASGASPIQPHVRA